VVEQGIGVETPLVQLHGCTVEVLKDAESQGTLTIGY